MSNKVNIQRKTLAAWKAANPILPKGVFGVVLNTHPARIKVGDGSTPWNSLDFLNEPKIGEIKYFSEPPDQPGWLKCDGKAYLRSEYPGYEQMRPKSAFAVQTISTNRRADGGMVWTGQYFVQLVANTRNVCRSTDGVNWTTLVNALPFQVSYAASLAAKGTSGHLVVLPAFFNEGVATARSTDHGATWSLGGNLPAGTQEGPYPYWTRPVLNADYGFVAVKSGANVLAHSQTGEVWTPVTIPGGPRAWECLMEANPESADTVFFAPSAPGSIFEYFYNEIQEMPYAPQAGAFNDYLGRLTSTSEGYAVGVSNLQSQVIVFEFSSWGLNQVLYDLPVNPNFVRAITCLDGRHIAVTGTHLLVIEASSRTVEYVSGLPELDGAFNSAAASSTEALFGKYSGDLLRITLDPLKFNAPGLAMLGDAFPYVYTGARAS